MSDTRAFQRAEQHYLTPPDDDEIECKNCDTTGRIWTMDENDECSECEGYGYISRKKKHQEDAEARADYEYDKYNDDKLTGDI